MRFVSTQKIIDGACNLADVQDTNVDNASRHRVHPGTPPARTPTAIHIISEVVGVDEVDLSLSGGADCQQAAIAADGDAMHGSSARKSFGRTRQCHL
eukprot:1560346-Prymnesium_polylepis.1